MGDTLKFDYYYGIEAEQFSFYRVPRLLIKDTRFRGLSSDAKLLYGLMLDRMSLSMKNGWLDDENRAYIIYTVDSIMEDLGCSKPTCTKIMRELDSDNGIGPQLPLYLDISRQMLHRKSNFMLSSFMTGRKPDAIYKPCNIFSSKSFFHKEKSFNHKTNQ